MRGKGQRYSAVHSVEPSSPAKMTKTKAFHILDLDETASMEEIQQKFDQTLREHTENPLKSPHAPEDLYQLVAAKTYLDNIEKHKIKNPVTSVITNQHKQSQRAAKLYQQTCDTYFAKLEELLTRIEKVNQTYLNPKNFVGKKKDDWYTQYKKEIGALFDEFKPYPPLLSSEVLTAQIKELMMQNILDNLSARGGPQQASQDELKRLKEKKAAVAATIKNMETDLRLVDTKTISVNANFARELLEAGNQEELDALQERYTQALRTQITAPLGKMVGRDSEVIQAITTLTDKLILPVREIGDLHLRHQAFITTTEKSNDPRVRAFLNEYNNYLQTLDQVVTIYPQFQQKFDQLSKDLYLLGSQYLLATLNPEVDRDSLTPILHTQLEKTIYNINQGFNNKEASKKDREWAQAWERLSPAVTELFADIHREKTFSTNPDMLPITTFQVEYNRYLKDVSSLQKSFSVPEHAAVLQNFRTRLEEIGEEFFAGILETEANLEELCDKYQHQFNTAIQDANDSFENAGGEKEALWPRLHPILQALATVIYFVRAYIKQSDEKIPERNRVFKAEKESFKEGYNRWFMNIPELDKAALSAQRSRLRKD